MESRPLTYEVREIALADICATGKRHRCPKLEKVESIAAGIERVGLMQPISVRPAQEPDCGYVLIAGLHRLQAVGLLHWASIKCHVYTGLSALEAEELELRENVDRAELSPAEIDQHLARLKEITEEKHELKRGGDRKSEAFKNQSPTTRGIDTKPNKSKASNAAKVVAANTGHSAKVVDRAAMRVRAIPQIAKVAGTSLDKSSELDALAKLPEPEQEELIDRAVTGETVSARAASHPSAAKEEAAPAANEEATVPKLEHLVNDPEHLKHTIAEKDKRIVELGKALKAKNRTIVDLGDLLHEKSIMLGKPLAKAIAKAKAELSEPKSAAAKPVACAKGETEPSYDAL